ncbi:MAG: DNA polymerase III subunit delta [Gammaproteobacteria bacterium]
MKLRVDQLERHLAKTLAPLYLVSGDEPLLVDEARERIRTAARERGFLEREILAVETGFDWGRLAAAADNLSLFGERRVLELRLPGGKPGEAGGRELVRYAERPPQDTVLVVLCPKLEGAAQRSAWYQALDRVGGMVTVWPVDRGRLPEWITQRMRTRGLEPAPEVAALLAERVEGNLLAAAQEVDKLFLLHGPGRVDLETATRAVTDSARFSIYDLVDSVLEGSLPRVVRVLNGVRAEGTDPVLVLWALSREVRGLARMAQAVRDGATLARVLAEHGVWERRKPLVSRGLRRHPVAVWRALLCRCARIDRVIKGAEAGSPWQELLQLGLAVAGGEPMDSALSG